MALSSLPIVGQSQSGVRRLKGNPLFPVQPDYVDNPLSDRHLRRGTAGTDAR